MFKKLKFCITCRAYISVLIYWLDKRTACMLFRTRSQHSGVKIYAQSKVKPHPRSFCSTDRSKAMVLMMFILYGLVVKVCRALSLVSYSYSTLQQMYCRSRALRVTLQRESEIAWTCDGCSVYFLVRVNKKAMFFSCRAWYAFIFCIHYLKLCL